MEPRGVTAPNGALQGAVVSLVWGDTTLCVRYLARGCPLVAGTEPDCDFILPPLPGLARWRARLLAWRGGELLARVPHGWTCRAPDGRLLDIRPPAAGVPIRLLVALSHAPSRSAVWRLLPVLALLAAFCVMIGPPLLDILRADPIARLDSGFTLTPVLLQVQAERGQPQSRPGAGMDSGAAAPPADALPAQQTWLDLVRRWSLPGLRGVDWPLRERFGFLPAPDPPLELRASDPVPPVEAELVRNLPRPSTWVPTGLLPFALRVRARECVRARPGSKAESWLWLGGEIVRGRLVGVWPLELDSVSERERTCLTKQLEGQPSGLPYERSNARFALHRPGTPMTELTRPPEEDMPWGSEWYWYWY